MLLSFGPEFGRLSRSAGLAGRKGETGVQPLHAVFTPCLRADPWISPAARRQRRPSSCPREREAPVSSRRRRMLGNARQVRPGRRRHTHPSENERNEAAGVLLIPVKLLPVPACQVGIELGDVEEHEKAE